MNIGISGGKIIMIKENLELLNKAKNFKITKRADDHYFVESKNTSVVADIYLYDNSAINPHIIEYGVQGVYNCGYDVAVINMDDLESLKSFCEFLVKE